MFLHPPAPVGQFFCEFFKCRVSEARDVTMTFLWGKTRNILELELGDCEIQKRDISLDQKYIYWANLTEDFFVSIDINLGFTLKNYIMDGFGVRI